MAPTRLPSSAAHACLCGDEFRGLSALLKHIRETHFEVGFGVHEGYEDFLTDTFGTDVVKCGNCGSPFTSRGIGQHLRSYSCQRSSSAPLNNDNADATDDDDATVRYDVAFPISSPVLSEPDDDRHSPAGSPVTSIDALIDARQSPVVNSPDTSDCDETMNRVLPHHAISLGGSAALARMTGEIVTNEFNHRLDDVDNCDRVTEPVVSPYREPPADDEVDAVDDANAKPAFVSIKKRPVVLNDFASETDEAECESFKVVSETEFDSDEDKDIDNAHVVGRCAPAPDHQVPVAQPVAHMIEFDLP